jgi:hypothetical protein
VDAQYGPLDWRLPEAHAIYWGELGLDEAKKNPDKVKQDDLMTLRRIVYQSLYQAFKHGRIISNPFNQRVELEPNLDLIPKVNDAYEQMMRETEKSRDNISGARRSFLRDAVYFLYEYNRVADAAKWYRFLGQNYPDKTILDGDPDSFPKNLTLDEYAVARVQEELGDTSQERTAGVVDGLLANAYGSLAIGQDDRYAGFKLLARKVYEHYQKNIARMASNVERVGLPPFEMLDKTVLNRLLDTQQPLLPFAARAVLRTQLGMTAETNAPPQTVSTNAIAPSVLSDTNVPASTNK